MVGDATQADENAPARVEEYDLHRLCVKGGKHATRHWMPIMFHLARLHRCTKIVEVGMFNGETTAFLVWAAILNGGRVLSIDNDVKAIERTEEHLKRVGLYETGRIFLIHGDSKTWVPQSPIDLLFIDGDHSAAGLKGDWENWTPKVEKGGLVFVHDINDPIVAETLFGLVHDYSWEQVNFPGDVGMAVLRRIP